MSLYEVLKFVHVMAAIVWIGGAAFHIFASTRLAGAPGPVALHWAEVGEASGQRFYMPASVVTLVAGVGMVLVADTIGFGEPWILVGFGGIVSSIVLGAVFVERATREMAVELRSDTPDQGTLAALAGRIRTLSALDVAVLTVVVWAMVSRPGA